MEEDFDRKLLLEFLSIYVLVGMKILTTSCFLYGILILTRLL